MGRPLAAPVRLDLRRGAALPGARDPLPGQSRWRGAAGTRRRLHPGSRRHRDARPLDRGAQAGPRVCRRSLARPRLAPRRASRAGHQPPGALAPGPSMPSTGRRTVRSPVLPSLRPGPAATDHSAICAGITAPSGAGPRWSSARAAPTPGRRSRPGCATSCFAPTSGATRSWSSAPSRA